VLLGVVLSLHKQKLTNKKGLVMKIHKMFKTEAAAERYIAKNFTWRQYVYVEKLLDFYCVVSN